MLDAALVLHNLGMLGMFAGANIGILGSMFSRKVSISQRRARFVMFLGVWIGSAAALSNSVFRHAYPVLDRVTPILTFTGVIILAVGFVLSRLPEKPTPHPPDDEPPGGDLKAWPPAPRA